MKICIVDERMPSEARRNLSKEGFYILDAKASKALPQELSSHPDMLFFLGKGRLVCHKDYFALAEEQINKIAHISNSEIIISDENMGRDYPHDVLFNAAAVGLCNGIGQRVIAGILPGAIQPGTPGFQIGFVYGICIRAHLQDDGIEA